MLQRRMGLEENRDVNHSVHAVHEDFWGRIREPVLAVALQIGIARDRTM